MKFKFSKVVGPLVLRLLGGIKEYFSRNNEVERYLSEATDHCDFEARLKTVCATAGTRNNMKSYRSFYSRM